MGLDDQPISPSSNEEGILDKSVEDEFLSQDDGKEKQEPVDIQSIEEFDRNLPTTVQLLNTPNGSKVYLVGTAHFSIESQNDVSKVIQTVKPHIIMVELCHSRANILKMDEETIEREAKNISFEKIREMIREHGMLQGLLYILLLDMSARLTKDLGMAPGGEFRRAFYEAKKLKNCLIHFGDRPINVTLKRAFSVLSWWQSIKLVWTILVSDQSMSKEEVEKCKEKDLLESMLAEMAGKFPELKRVFVEERDVYLTYSLQLAAQALAENLNPEDYALSAVKVVPSIRNKNKNRNHEPRIINSIRKSINARKNPENVFLMSKLMMRLRKLKGEPTTVVGIVGIGHAAGITKNWMKVTDNMIPPLMVVPPSSRSSRIITVSLKLAGLGLLLWGCSKLIPKPKSVSNALSFLPKCVPVNH